MGLVIKIVAGLVLFVASLVGGLAATGRLNHEGCANIPVLSGLFPPPPEPPAEGEAGAESGAASGGEHGEASAEAGHGAPADAHATPSGESKDVADASHGAAPQGDEPQGEQGPRKQKVGKSLVQPEEKAGGGGHGGGEPAADAHGDKKDAHGTDAKKDAHGAEAKGDEHGKDEHGKGEHGKGGTDKGHGTPEGDFQGLEDALTNGRNPYKPGDLFRFSGLPAGVTPEQINEAWTRVQGLMAEIERRKVVLDQQEQQLRELSEDISRRQAALNKESVEIEQMHRKLDAKIQKFQEQVKMVRTDEVAALKRNAVTIASFEPKKAAEMFEAQWKTDKGQDEVLKLLEVMDKDAANAILNEMPVSLAAEVMRKRQRVSKEPAPAGKGS